MTAIDPLKETDKIGTFCLIRRRRLKRWLGFDLIMSMTFLVIEYNLSSVYTVLTKI